MIELFIRTECPYCQKVLRAVKGLDMSQDKDYTLIDASPGTQGLEIVRERGGDTMVPFLIDGDVAMYESDDIIAYLRNKFSSLQG